VIVVFHYLFFATEEGRSLPQDPTSTESASNPLRFWEPRLSGEPNATESFKNALAGVITISNTRASIIDDDFVIRSIIGGDNDSLSNKAAVIWFSVNGVVTQLFSGACGSGFDISGSNIISLAIYDLMNKLTQTATMGLPVSRAFATRTTYSRLDPAKQFAPVPFVMGAVSPHRIAQNRTDATESSVSSKIESGLLEATNIDYFAFAQNNKNRDWLACNQIGNPTTQSFGSLQAYAQASFGGSSTSHLFFRFASYSNVRIGDVLEVDFNNDDGNGDQTGYFEVVHVGTFNDVSGPTTYNIMAEFYYVNAVPTNLSKIDAVSANTSFSVILMQGTRRYWLAKGRDYSLSYFSNALGVTITITLADNFEASYAPFGNPDTIDPSSDKIFFRTTGSGHTHAEAMQLMIERSGLTANSASFTQADSDLSANVNFTIPAFDESSYRQYLNYCENLAKSTMGYIAPNADGEIVYQVLSQPSATDAIDDNLFLDGSLKTSINYKDIKTGIVANNPNVQDETEIDAGTAAVEASSAKAQYLHGLDETEEFRHVLDDISGRIDDIMAVKAERRLTYQFSTATKNIDSSLGDDVTLETSALAGSASSVNGKINKIARSSKNTTVTIDDLKDLS
jgi:hypothetical protein